MHRIAALTVTTIVATGLAGCGGGRGPGYYQPLSPPPLVSYVGTTGVFVAWANGVTGDAGFAPMGSYAGKKQALRGTNDFLTGAPLGQPAGVEVYKGADGHIYALDLTAAGGPQAQPISTETAATVDDTCTFSGTAVTGANYDYVGVYFTADLQNPVNSTYVYRLPGPDGVCNTADDVFHAVKTGMSASTPPITVAGMPVATVRTPEGGISGFVLKSGSTLVEVDSNFANPVVLGTFAAPIGVAVALPVGTTQGYPTAQLYVVDGNIVYVDYAAHSTSAPLYTIPGWSPTAAGALFAASPTTLYLAVNTPASGAMQASAAVYAMPSDGSAAPVLADTETGRITGLVFPVSGTTLAIGVANSSYQIRALSTASGTVSTVVTTTGNSGTFVATASTVYWTSWMATYDAATKTDTHSATQSGIVAMNGTVIQTPLAESTFASGGEQFPWPADTVTTTTPYETVFQIQNLTPVQVINPATSETYVFDGVSGGTVVAIDTASNTPGPVVGLMPNSTATSLSGTFRNTDHSGFLEATTPASTQSPATRDLVLLNSQMTNTLTPLTANL
jgi:hypothetical protein